MKVKNTMKATVLFATFALLGGVASGAMASTITCLDGAGQVGYSIYPSKTNGKLAYTVQARSNKRGIVKAYRYYKLSNGLNSSALLVAQAQGGAKSSVKSGTIKTSAIWFTCNIK